MLEGVSIIIPLALKENNHDALLSDLKETQAEIILSSEGTRVESLNKGAAKAKYNMLWFLHADSRISVENIKALDSVIKSQPNALHYFYLRFDEGGLLSLNGLGANIRSRLLGLPYGDQGLCISKKQFESIGGYPDTLPYGEDVLFVRKAKKAGVKLNPTGSKLMTSARKYQTQGWLNVTWRHQCCLFNLLRQKL